MSTVVDDDPQALGSVQCILEDAGYDTLTTGDPEEVAGLLATGAPDLVVLDLMLPGTDGIELLQRLPALGDRPVIFLSVYGRDETIARALEMGAADYVVKPFSPTELVARIRAALRRAWKPEPCSVRDLVSLLGTVEPLASKRSEGRGNVVACSRPRPRVGASRL